MKDNFRKKKKDDEVIEVTITDDGFVMKDVMEAYKVEKKIKRRQQVRERLNDSLKFVCEVGLPLLIAVEPDEPTGIREQPAKRSIGRLYGEMEHTAAGTNGLYPTSDRGDKTATSNSSTPTEPERTVKQSSPKRRR